MRDSVPSLKSDARQIGDYIKEHFENLEDKPSIVEQCMYMVCERNSSTNFFLGIIFAVYAVIVFAFHPLVLSFFI